MVSKTGIGIGNGIPFGNNSSGGDRPYLSPELKSRLRIVAHTFGKRNEDSDRATIRNLVDPDNPLLIKNAAFKLNSGFGKYEVDFLDYSIVPNVVSITRTSDKLSATNNDKIGQMLLYRNIADSSKPNTPAFKIKVSNLTDSIRYYYIDESDTTKRSSINITSDGVYDLPESKNTLFNGITSVNIGFGIDSSCSVTIEQIPSLEDSFISDGVNDIIESTKTFAETFGEDCKEFTIVSMIRLIGTSAASSNSGYTNYFRSGNNYTRNNVTNADKTGIYGYYANLNNQTFTIVDYVLGDKNDYKVNVYTPDGSIANSKFTPIGYIGSDGTLNELRLSAYTFTIGAIGKLTEDDINQIIGYYNLDRTVKADIYCNITKQGITNENHADFNDKLIDYSGNGRDIQMNNLGWVGGSGIAAKEYETFKDWYITNTGDVILEDEFNVTVSTNNIDNFWHCSIRRVSNYNTVYPPIKVIINQENLVVVNECAYTLDDSDKYNYSHITENLNIGENYINTLSIDKYSLPEGAVIKRLSTWIKPVNASVNITSIRYTLVPSCKGGIVLDGISDFGKAIGLPVYKDYTVIADRELFNVIGCVLSNDNLGAFVFETSSASAYSFGEPTTSLTIPTDKQIRYQTKYSYNGQNISIGAVKEGTSNMWLGTIRDNDARFRSAAIYSLMSFPYSMSKFLIERQLKKHKLGTLYPNMVEFRPVIKANANYKITYYQIDSTNTWKSIKLGDYIVIGAKLAFQITFDNDASELKEVVSPQLSGIIVEKRPSNPGYNIYSYITSKSPQKINITIDEYIRFEDIVQPYPVLLRFNDENGNEVSWGGKFRVGSTITRIGSIADPESNLLNGLYSINGLTLNGEVVTSSAHIVEKQMVFKTTATYLLDNNEPKCILSPRLLRIPNSSYKILGYIPDISGHGNHGVIHNSAYAGMSGANGYGTNLGNWNSNSPSYGKVINQREEYLEYEVLSENENILFYNVKVVNETFIIYADIDTHIIYSGESNIIANIPAKTPTKVICSKIGTILLIADEIPTVGNIITIQQVGQYEGAFCLDGVNDFVEIPTTVGGKQVLLKCVWDSKCYGNLLYDQRTVGVIGSNAILVVGEESSGEDSKIAYYARNTNGKTYIDGILNEYIHCNSLIDKVHNITITNPDDNNRRPVIGASNRVSPDFFSSVKFYDIMLFDEIDSDEEIINLNKYVGIEPKIEIPNWYYDVHGKTNLIDGTTFISEQIGLQKNGTSGNYLARNYNFEYNKMSGYEGYSFSPFSNTDDWLSSTTTPDTVEIVSIDGYSYTARRLEGTTWWKYRNVTTRELNNDLVIKFRCNKTIRVNWEFKYRTAEQPDADSTLAISSTSYSPNTIHTVTLKHKTQEERDALGVISYYYLIYFAPTEIPVGEEYTVEMLPLYPNGLVYDGVSDYTEVTNIPTMTDFTLLIKALRLTDFIGSGGAVIKKGDRNSVTGGGYDFVYCLDSSTTEANRNSYWSFGKACLNPIAMPLIGYMTKTNVNGVETTFGTNPSKEGITIGFWAGSTAMVFYKTIIYDKTVEQFWIDFLRNMMAREEIIDITYPIFVQGTGGG